MKVTRKIVRIDPDKCDGCGLCIPKCHEGAIRIIDGKARLVAENLCDGLGVCLGECPRDAISVEVQEVDPFDERAVEVHRIQETRQPAEHGGCPGAGARTIQRESAATGQMADDQAPRQSRLDHWPVQLSLVPASGAIWQDADVLVAADCVPFAYAEFHEKLLAGPGGKGRTLAIACPKLDDVGPYVEKLAAIFVRNRVKSVTVARMEVPCCGGIVRVVQAALQQAGRGDIAMQEVVIGIDGTVRASTRNCAQ